MTELTRIALQRKGAGALTGAAAGAAAGSSVLPGIGTLIGGGLGLLGGGLLSGGVTEEEKARQARINKLKRMQELNMLGLSDAERSQLEAQLINPVRETQREAQEAFMRGASTADLGAGSFFAAQQAAAGQLSEDVAKQKQKIEAANIQRQKEQRQELRELRGEQADAVKESGKQAQVAALKALETGVQIGGQIASKQLVDTEAAKLMEESMGVPEAGKADIDELKELNQAFGFFDVTSRIAPM
jgi:hypothetical protein